MNYKFSKECSLSAGEFHERYAEETLKFDNLFAGESIHDIDQVKTLYVKTINLVPVNEDLVKTPSSYNDLSTLLKDRLALKCVKKGGMNTDQKHLVESLLLALQTAWHDFRRQATHPLMDEDRNKELKRCVAVKMIERAEQLFTHYTSLVQEMNKKKVFGSEVNISRYKTQILHDAHKKFNIGDIRRQIANEMRLYRGSDVHEKHTRNTITGDNPLFVSDQINELRNELPNIARLKRKVQRLNMENEDILKQRSQVKEVEAAHIAKQSEDDLTELGKSHIQDIKDTELLPHFASMPDLLREGEKLCADLTQRCTSLEKNVFHNNAADRKETQVDEQQPEMNAYRDLQRLVARNKTLEGSSNLEDDFPQMLQITSDSPLPTTTKQQHEKQQEKQQMMRSHSVASTVDTVDAFDLQTQDEEEESVLTVKVYGQNGGIYRLSDSKTSDSQLQPLLVLQKHPAIYNEFTGEIDAESVEALDSHLQVSANIKEVYDEICKTVNQNYLCFDVDSYVEPCIPVSVGRPSLDQPPGGGVVVNEDLVVEQAPPWMFPPPGDEDEWEYTPQFWRNRPVFAGFGREDMIQHHKKEEATSNNKTNSSTEKNETRSAWMSWYNHHINIDDYKKFLSTTDSDYLSTIFHLFERVETVDVLAENPQEQDQVYVPKRYYALGRYALKMAEKVRMKTRYEEGVWNTQTVLLGGLGKHPKHEGDEDTTCPFVELQSRFSKIWESLKMPEEAQLEQAIKYSRINEIRVLTNIVELWEEVCELIVRREELIKQLELFERTASDPNRFFEKGENGSSAARLIEAKSRAKINKLMKDLEKKISPALKHLKKYFNDQVTFCGRCYASKMTADRVEMLYWLQQQRRRAQMT